MLHEPPTLQPPPHSRELGERRERKQRPFVDDHRRPLVRSGRRRRPNAPRQAERCAKAISNTTATQAAQTQDSQRRRVRAGIKEGTCTRKRSATTRAFINNNTSQRGIMVASAGPASTCSFRQRKVKHLAPMASGQKMNPPGGTKMRTSY
jgi:hypothetical protein